MKIVVETLKPLKLEIEILQSSMNHIEAERELIDIKWRFDLQVRVLI